MMNFHVFGDRKNKSMVLIHGMLTPWQIFGYAAEFFAGREEDPYFVVVPELDAHTEDEPTRFCSVEDEAEKIRRYAMDELGGRIDVLAGLSMGGRIAALIAGMPDVSVGRLVLDGAPLIRFPDLLVAFLTKNYISIVMKSKKRDQKTLESCRRNFLPENYMEPFLKIADNFDEGSVEGIMKSVFSSYEFRKFESGMKILFMHGTTGNEMFARKAALRMKELNPETEIRCYDGYSHARLACFEIEKWTKEVAEFLAE